LKEVLQGGTLQQAVQHAHLSQALLTALSSPDGIEYLKVGYVLDVFSRYGVIFLLFLVGVESSISELRHTGMASFRVALVGVLAPLILGFAVSYYAMPGLSITADLFIAATLCATSIGVTARVLKEMDCIRTREAKTILGAAMIDDILGLFILAVVSGMVVHGYLDIMQMFQVLLGSTFFFVAVLAIGPWILRHTLMGLQFFEPWESKLIVSFVFLMTAAWLATVVNLAAIIGAFAAGLVIHDGYFAAGASRSIRDLVSPLESLMAPLFFVLIGIQVKLETFLDVQVLSIAFGLTVAAIIGKLLSGLAASRKDNRLFIGIGMLPRGEVGLVFASIGKSLGVMTDQVFAAVILMIIITTVITPPTMRFFQSALAR
ncbi:MAG: cation:proton antiporter, partial [Methylococcales bacterium]|nr:cation:proton antiporter [Methylococcales bacterium]